MKSGEVELQYMLDSNVLRHIAATDAGFQRIFERIIGSGVERICLSTLAAAEIHKALNNHKLTRAERDILRRIFIRFRLIEFDVDAAKLSGELVAKHIRKGGADKAPDYMIAGHAVHLGLTLVTDNERHFKEFPSLKWENWKKAATA